MIERIGAAASGIEQHPEEPAVVLRAPADVVEHDGSGKALGLEEALHQLHRNEVALIGLGGGHDGVAVALGPSMGIEQSLGEVAGRKQLEQAKLVLPAQAVGLEFVEQVEHGKVAAELLTSGLGGEVLGSGFLPVEDDSLVLNEPKRLVHARIGAPS